MEGWSSRRCALTWKLKGTPYNRSYFQLAVSVLPTEETECGLLLGTPTAGGDEGTGRSAKFRGKNKAPTPKEFAIQFSKTNLLLTPTTREEVMDTDKFKERMEKYDNGTTVPNLATQVVGMLPTPNAFDWNTARSPKAHAEAKAKYGSTLQDTLRQRAGQGSQLSPLFVEEMMGFPKNWTASPFQSGDEKA